MTMPADTEALRERVRVLEAALATNRAPRRFEIVARFKAGQSDRKIATEMNISLDNVRNQLKRARQKGELPTTKDYKVLIPIRLSLSLPDINHLTEEASRRRVTRNYLIRDLLRHIIDGDLFKAVLDD